MTDSDLFAAWRERDERARLGQAAYEAMKATGRLKHHRMLTYRCKTRGCVLLDVLQLPAPVGMVFYQPNYKLSRSVNEAQSTPEGRARNTVDGDRRWKARAQVDGTPINYSLVCDHLNNIALPTERVGDDLAAGRKVVTITAADHAPETGWQRFTTDSGNAASWRIVED